jgi:O-antigen/teichoic acid export membrane protein
MSTSKNTLYNLVGALLPIALSLITIPAYIGLIGDARYGVLAIAWLLLDYFGLFDLGLGRATSQRIASLREATPSERAKAFWTALVINMGFGFIGGLIAWPVASYFFGHAFSIEDSLRSEMLAAIPWLILAVPLTTLSGVLTGALQGREKFLELNLISTLGSALIQVVPLTVAYLQGPDLAWLLPAVIASKIVTLTVLVLRCREHVFKQQPRVVSGTEARRLLKFGGWVTVSTLISPLMSMLDRFAISALMGARFVTYYSVPFQLGQRSAVIPGALASAVLPRLSVANDQEAKRLNNLAISSLAVVMTPVMLAGMLLIEPFIGWWLSPEFAQHAALLSKLLMFGFWVNAFAFIPFVHMQASGRPDVVAKCHLGEVLPYLLGLYIGLHYFGLTGAAAAYTLRTVADCLILMYLSDNLKQHARLLVIPLIMIVASLITAIAFPPSSLLWLVASVGMVTASLLWSFKNMPDEMRVFLNMALPLKNHY